MTFDLAQSNRRILIVDDQEAIHRDFMMILAPNAAPAEELDAASNAFLAQETDSTEDRLTFEVDSAFQGNYAVEMVLKATAEGQPYALAFVDMRMPPGWDGIETIQRLWEVAPDLEIVICSAYSDYSWVETTEKLGHSSQLLILKKPFDNTEISQLACGLTLKWNLARRAETKLDELQAMVDKRTSELRAAKMELEDRVEQRTAELQVALSASESTSRAKSEFLANTSHELCSPLNSLLILAQSLAANYEGNLTSAQVQAADVIYQDGRNLLALINDILDLARLEAGQMKAFAEPVDLCLLAGTLSKKFSPLTDQKGLILKCEVADDLPTTMITDPQRVEHVLQNLLSNALKFTESGSVTLRINRPGWDTRFL
jgi:signal transduction histidine kinase